MSSHHNKSLWLIFKIMIPVLRDGSNPTWWHLCPEYQSTLISWHTCSQGVDYFSSNTQKWYEKKLSSSFDNLLVGPGLGFVKSHSSQNLSSKGALVDDT